MNEAEEQSIKEAAITYAKENKKQIAVRLTDINKYPPEEEPVSVFMAGSPGAGKTESSKNLIDRFVEDGHSILRIDTDDLRESLPGYNGKNSHLFQAATSIIADRMHDLALKQCQSFVFDGTLTNLERARENIQRSIRYNRVPYVLYVYQDPLQAWKFVKAREMKDGRSIPKPAFIEQYFRARENVNLLKTEFSKQLHVDLIVKNIDGTDFNYFENISKIDGYIPQRYTSEELERLIEMP